MTTVRKLLTTALLLSLCSVCVGAEGLTFGVAGSDASIADKPHGLPLIAITTNTALNAQKKVMAHMKTDGYDGPISIKLRGNSSLGFNQKKYTVETCDAQGNDVDVSLLGLPSHSKWVLLAPYNDISMMRDPLAFQLWRDMGHWGPRTVMCELTVDGDYRGIYILAESIKQGSERVNIDKMSTTDVKGRALTGGYLLRIDTFNEDDATFTSKVPGIGDGIMSSEVIWSCIYPKKKNLQPQQMDYIRNYVDTVEQVIQADYFADPQKGYAKYIDVPSFVDYFIHTELSLNADAYRRSAYFYKERQRADGTGGKLFAGPVWDYNLAYGNCNFANANNLEAWCYVGASNNPTPAIWQRLLQDPAFRLAVKQRYQQLRKGVLSLQALYDFIDRQSGLLSEAIEHHFKTYPELLVSEERKQQLAEMQKQFEQMGQQNPMGGGFPPFGGFPGGIPEGGFPPSGAFPDSIPGGGFPPFGGFPDSIPGGFPPFGAFPDSIPGGFPPFGGFPPGMGSPDGGGQFQFDMIGMFAAYRVSSYEEEITILKQWLADRLAFLDRNIERFDSGWEPRVQPLVEKKMEFPGGAFPFWGPPSE